MKAHAIRPLFFIEKQYTYFSKVHLFAMDQYLEIVERHENSPYCFPIYVTAMREPKLWIQSI